MYCPRCESAELENKSRNGQIFLVCPACALIKVNLRSQNKEAQITSELQPKLELQKLVYNQAQNRRAQLEAEIRARQQRLAAAREYFQQVAQPPLHRSSPSQKDSG